MIFATLKGGTVNTKGYKDELEKRIREIPEGVTFAASDFSDIAGVRTIRELLRRMMDKDAVIRVMPGIYMRPLVSKFLNTRVPADPEDVAYSIARVRNWTIAPSGNTALNKLGLSTQVPVVWSYVSDGPYYEKTLWGNTISFKHVANRNITGMSAITLLVVQALKALGKDRIDKSVLQTISERLSDEDTRTVISETERATVWIRDVVRAIAQEKYEAC
jgi:hypothetical protein